MVHKNSRYPAVVVRAEQPDIEVLQKEEENSEAAGGGQTVWTEDTIAILREILPLLEETEDGIVVRYNFTHLSNILKIDKRDIYVKIIELYHGEDETTQDTAAREVLAKSAAQDVDPEVASVDSLINVAAASKLLHSRRLLGQPSGDESSLGGSEASSVEESLLQREILENEI